MIREEFFGAVDKILAQVIVFARSRWNVVLVVPEFWGPLIFLTAQKTVVPVEAALRWPVVEWPYRAAFCGRHEVPFSQCVSAVAILLKHLCQRSRAW